MTTNTRQNFVFPEKIIPMAATIDELDTIISAVRVYLKMDIAIISEVKNENLYFRHVDVNPTSTFPQGKEAKPYQGSYCQALVNANIPGLIQNTHINAVTSKLIATQASNIGSFIGALIYLADGSLYGSVYCFQNQPDYTLNERDLSVIEYFANLIGKTLDSHTEKSQQRHEIESRINNVIENDLITMHYQPILDLNTNNITGYESLARFHSDPYVAPDIWFKDAYLIGMDEKLEMLAVKSALQVEKYFRNNNHYLSINVSPAHILSGALERVIEHISCEVLVEITEHQPIADYVAFQRAFNSLRCKRVKLAIDDVGTGYSNLSNILELEPDIIKLDLSLTRDIHKDRKRIALASAMCTFAKEMNCEIIAEGIENRHELNKLKELGVNKGQGYFIGRPSPFVLN
ncbi:EAL domain-containing protein [Marinomonas rhizomae]|uniref:EAL domain-containing protein (Putative c-di-GMP-specific phosphodiesterase class I) n=1 Tax=Marinomonas rhizomae TaxID=491948 RepID=A0A366IXQ0_9GAMM|nr:EAL domain-containing protein [Marinomonas rhizomae]RBP79596.1 EAL domain-containing protein (putative c-di-GMP-specific phosphodiesterase class I) [Marinomonas rhizomae]RNF71595.1 EAL domain-containing protein [Marinomonas rhizomae]